MVRRSLALALAAACLAGCVGAPTVRPAPATANGGATAKNLFHKQPVNHELQAAYKGMGFDGLLGMATRLGFGWDNDPMLAGAIYQPAGGGAPGHYAFVFGGGFDFLAVHVVGDKVTYEQRHQTLKELICIDGFEERRLIPASDALRAAKATGQIKTDDPLVAVAKSRSFKAPMYFVADLGGPSVAVDGFSGTVVPANPKPSAEQREVAALANVLL